MCARCAILQLLVKLVNKIGMAEEKDNNLNPGSVPADAGAQKDAPAPNVGEEPVTVVVGGKTQDGKQEAEISGGQGELTSQKANELGSEAEKAAETPADGEGKEGKAEEEGKKGKKKKGKKKKKDKKTKALRPKIHPGDIPGLLFPEHVGDIFMVAMILALAVGAGAFWFLAWIPTHEVAVQGTQDNIQQFSDKELQDIITILENREEASQAPVITPDRDPFFQ